MRLRYPLWLAVNVAFGFPVTGRADEASLSVTALFANPAVHSPTLSPNGESFAYVRSLGDVDVIFAGGLGGSSQTPVARVSDPEIRLTGLYWANDTRLLLSGEARSRNSVGVRARTTVLYGVDRDGKNFDWLGKRWPLYGQLNAPIQFQDDIAHLTPNDPESVLMNIQPPYEGDLPIVMKMNVMSGKLSPYHGSRRNIKQWIVDSEGQVRGGWAFPAGEAVEFWSRISADDPFSVSLTKDSGLDFAGFHADPAKLYVSKSHEGRAAIFEYSLRDNALGALVFAHPEVDVDGLYRSPTTHRVLGVRFTTDSPQIHFLDESAAREYRSLSAALAKTHGQAVQFEATSASGDGRREVLRVSSDTQPPVSYLWDRKAKRLAWLLDENPKIDAARLSPTKRVTYTARDGLAIPAFLTLPIGRGEKNLPLVVLPHGGPWARDVIAWNPEVQLFSSRGFAVLQPNFRGSTGYGAAHFEAGYREWGGKIQDDITDGVKWAIAEGIADPARIGIYGTSYGGYSALMGAVKTPDLYRAAASYAGVSDIPMTLSDWERYRETVDYTEQMIGGERGDRERLRAHSPLVRASEVRIPILLGHGADDPTVHARQSQRMAAALRKAGKDVEYLEFPNEIHGFALEANAIRWYETLIAFFEKNLAPRATTEPAASH